jgi:uncharacterized pyridoxal phosphate-containing UPF0001 family protein
MYFERLERALPGFREELARACGRAGRSDADSITVVAVTKGHPLEATLAARDAGLQVIGENRVQEAQAKWEVTGDLGLSWHLVGHLQRNKVRQALKVFDLIHSLDSLRLRRLSGWAAGHRSSFRLTPPARSPSTASRQMARSAR